MTAPSSDSAQDRTTTLSTIEPSTSTKKERRWLRRLGKSLLVLIILGGLAFGGYLLWPTVDENYLQPISDNEANIVALTERLDDIEARVAELETRTDTIIAASESERAADTDVVSRFDELEAAIDAQAARLEGLEDTAFGLAEADEVAAARVTRDLTILRAMELMSRARLSLYQANYGLAREDISAARLTLEDLDGSEEAISEAIARLDVSAAALPDRPVAAAADLDIAWQALLGNVVAPVTGTTVVGTPTTSTTATTTP